MNDTDIQECVTWLMETRDNHNYLGPPWAENWNTLRRATMNIEIIGNKWWAVQGSNLWPLPCQGKRLGKTTAISIHTDALGPCSFNIGSLGTLGHHGPKGVL